MHLPRVIGFDGLLNFYAGRNQASDLTFEAEFKKQVGWDLQMGNPYVACADKELLDRIASDDMVRGVTIACGGFLDHKDVNFVYHCRTLN